MALIKPANLVVFAVVGAIVLLWAALELAGGGADDRAAKEVACRADIGCLAEREASAAGVYCAGDVEKLAVHSVHWTEGFGARFSRYRWKDQAAGVITFIGDRAEFQNGFGAYTPVTYECDFKPDTKTVLDVRASEGRLP